MCSAQVATLHLAFFILVFHSSAPLLSDSFLDTARQSLIFTELLPGLSRPKSAGPMHFRNSEDDFGYMANLPHSTGHEPNQPDKMVPADDDPTPINDPDHDSICDFSKTTQKNAGWFGVPTVWESIPNRTLSRVETATYSRRKSLENRAEKAKERVFGNKKQDNESWQRQAIGNKGNVVAKKNERVCWYREDLNAWLFGKVYQYLQKKLDVTDSPIEELGSAKTNILIWGIFMSSPTKSAVFMNVYVEEIKYLFSILQKMVLENYDEPLNLEVIDSNDPYLSGQQQNSTCSQIPSFVFGKFLKQQKRWRDGKDSW